MKNKTTPEILIENLESLIKKTGWSNREIARRSGGSFSDRAIGKILNRENSASVEMADNIAKVFGLTGWQLIMPCSRNTKDLLTVFVSLSDYNQQEVIAYAKGRKTIGDPPNDSVAQQAQAINDALDILDEEGMLTLTHDERVSFIEELILAKIGSEQNVKRSIINHIKTKIVN